MSVILDALKKAQQERKKINLPLKDGRQGSGSGNRSRLVLYPLLVVAVVIILVALFYPYEKGGKVSPVTATVKAEQKIVPATKEEPAVKAEVPASKVEVPAAKEQKPPVEARKVPAPAAPRREAKVRKEAVPKTRAPSATSGKKATATSAKPPARTDSAGQVVPAPKSEEQAELPRITMRRTGDERITAMYNQAVRNADSGRPHEARKIYEDILRERPDHAEVLNNLGVMTMQEGKSEEARSYFAKALAHKKDYAKVYNNMGLLSMKEGNRKLAAEYFTKSIEIDGNSVEPYLNLSALLRSENRQKDASTLLERIIGRDIADDALYLSFAIIKDEMAQHGDAIKYYRLFLRTGGDTEQRDRVIKRLKVLEDSQSPKNR